MSKLNFLLSQWKGQYRHWKSCFLYGNKRFVQKDKFFANYYAKTEFSTCTSKLAQRKLNFESGKSPKLVGLNEGKEFEGFVVQEVSDIPEFRLSVYRLRHNPTGAQYLHIHRDDTNNVFSVGFRTTPNNSTGLPHILEHTTLCGSKRYPCRDPFFKMLNRSMATFMNAMTGPDYTIYPFATQNAQDYRNLMSVYLDAVFCPQLRELDFRQEGWRLEPADLDDPNSAIILKGVVFNEMKGVFSENQSLFEQKLLNSILPSHTYGFVSGGHPLEIPNLTYQDLKTFHSRYYSPCNSRFYSYGNFPLVDHLKYINRNYLSNFKDASPEDGIKTRVPSEVRWSAAKRRHVDCRPDPLAADPRKQSTIAVSVLCSDIRDVQETFELQVLSQLLVQGPSAPMYRSLVEPGIGAGFAPATGYDSHTRDTVFTVGLQGVNPADFDTVVMLYDETLTRVVDTGFEAQHLEAVLHGIELNMKHQSADFGLGLLFGLTPLWNHDGDLVQALQMEQQVARLRHHLLENPRHLQDMVQRHMLANTHRLVLTMSPDTEYEARQASLERDILETKLAALSKQKKELLYQQGLQMREEQGKAEDTSSLPTLRTEDLKKEIELTALSELQVGHIPVQLCSQPTNGVVYFRGVVNTSQLSEDLKRLLPLFCQVATKMGTRHHDYRELDRLAQLKTGGLSLCTHIADDTMDTATYEEGVLFASYCLDRHVPDMMSLWGELFNDGVFGDVKRFETLVRMSAAQLVNGVADMGHHYAIASSASLVSPSAHRKELYGGLSHVAKMREIAQMSDLSPVLRSMEQIAKSIFNKKHLRCAVNVSPGREQSVLRELETFATSLSGTVDSPLLKTRQSDLEQPARGIHHVHPIPVNFAAKSLPTIYYCHADFAPLRVLARLVTSKFLHPHIREKGGAYGSGLSLSPSGVLSFYSYRDPNTTATFDTFDQASAWVQQNAFSDEDIEEAKLGVFQVVDAPVPPGSKGMNKFLYGIDDLLLQMHRAALMSVSRQDLLRVADTYLAQPHHGRALLGPENRALQPAHYWKTV